ncbi:MAG: hypothetical protein ACT4OO_00225 [Nitrospiraceae bacterium]
MQRGFLALAVALVLVTFSCVCLFFGRASAQPPSPLDLFSTSTLIYVSDYFSFVGSDSQGRVAFALDNNRGRDGDAYQAEHLVVLHDEYKGWIDVVGNGFYDNAKKELTGIPDSPFFHFQSTPETGLTITSAKNNLTLKIDSIPQRSFRTDGKGVVWMGTAPATLTWQGRTISGRVIYEYLVMPDFNRLTRTYWGLWKEFQGFYLLAGRTDDVYLHSQQSEWIAPLVGKLAGLAVLRGATERMTDLQVEVLDHDLALGFYRWPTAWRITWQGAKGLASMTLTLSQRKGIGNWAIGGFSMGIVRGELSSNGRTWPIYGLVELLI